MNIVELLQRNGLKISMNQLARNFREEQGGGSCLGSWFGKKVSNCVHLWVLFVIKNIALRVSRKQI